MYLLLSLCRFGAFFISIAMPSPLLPDCLETNFAFLLLLMLLLQGSHAFTMQTVHNFHHRVDPFTMLGVYCFLF